LAPYEYLRPGYRDRNNKQPNRTGGSELLAAPSDGLLEVAAAVQEEEEEICSDTLDCLRLGERVSRSHTVPRYLGHGVLRPDSPTF
jgi:hypothetical protein